MKIKMLFSILFFVFFQQITVVAQCSDTVMANTLRNFYINSGGNPTNVTGLVRTWKWVDVAIVSSSISVVKNIRLSNHGLSGSQPLTTLFQSGCVGNLDTLDLSFNQFSGSLPTNLFNRLLNRVALNNNNFSGILPSNIPVQKTIQYLDLSHNGFSGRAPFFFGASILNSLLMSYNQFTASPISLDYPSVRYLDLSNNNITGGLPNIDSLLSLQILNLQYNQFTGTIPLSMTRRFDLSFLLLSHNKLTGAIPPQFGDSKRLQFLDLSNNQLTGTIPPELNNIVYNDNPFTTLRYLLLDSNQLSGTIPRLGRLYQLNYINLAKNNLTGNLPIRIDSLQSLATLNVSDNQLSGAIPQTIKQLSQLVQLDISNNRFDSLPIFPGGGAFTLGGQKQMFIKGNKFTFDDILPQMVLTGKLVDIKYVPQDSVICPAQNVDLKVTENYTIALGIDGALTTNEYRWYKNGKLFDRTNANSLTLKNVSACDNGIYECRITNPSVPGLTLYCLDQNLAVAEPYCGASMVFELQIYPNPAAFDLNIKVSNPPETVAALRIHDAAGRLVFHKKMDSNDLQSEIKLNVASFPNGAYFLSLHTEGGKSLLMRPFQVLRK
jgi:Leucine-rich repeat (LRR) protein